MTREQLLQICEEELQTFALHTPEYLIQVHPIAGGWWVGYCHKDATRHDFDGTGFDLNIDDNIRRCYLLHISVLREHRGKGHGSQLYTIVENIARRAGCTMLEQYPSGTTHTGERRGSYLRRRGYELRHDIAVKQLFS